MPSKLTKLLVENYAKANEYIDIEDMSEEDMEEFENETIDEEIDEEVIDAIIEELTNIYNNSDEEIQEQLDALLEEEDGIEAMISLLIEDEDDDEEDESEHDDQENLQELKVPSKWTKFKHKLVYGSTPKETARRVASSTSANPGSDKSIKNASDKTLHNLKGSSKENPAHGSPRHMQIRAIDRELKRRSTNEENVQEENLQELKKSTLASYAGKAAKHIRTTTTLARSFADDKYEHMKKFNKNHPNNMSDDEKDPDELERAEKSMDAAEKLEKEYERKASNRIKGITRATKKLAKEEVDSVEEDYLGIANPEVKTTKATAPSSIAPGPTIDQPSKLGLKKLSGFIRAKSHSATNPGTAIDQPSKQGLEKPEVKTKKVGLPEETEPKLGTVKANIMNTKEPTVQVQEFKQNKLRGDSYWVTKEVRKFKTLELAKAYVDRINKK